MNETWMLIVFITALLSGGVIPLVSIFTLFGKKADPDAASISRWLLFLTVAGVGVVLVACYWGTLPLPDFLPQNHARYDTLLMAMKCACLSFIAPAMMGYAFILQERLTTDALRLAPFTTLASVITMSGAVIGAMLAIEQSYKQMVEAYWNNGYTFPFEVFVEMGKWSLLPVSMFIFWLIFMPKAKLKTVTQ